MERLIAGLHSVPSFLSPELDISTKLNQLGKSS